jgi:diguanylate cyclase (GGDEF)-like protein/PAS domain S-box-containing protein
MTFEREKDKIQLNQINTHSHDIEMYFDSVFNNIHDPIFVKDHKFRFVLVNDAFCRIFALSRNQIIGTTLAENLPTSEVDHFSSIDRKVLETGTEIVCEETVSPNGLQANTVITRKKRFIDSEGNYFIIGVVHDITVKEQLNREINDANKQKDKRAGELVIANQEKDKRADELVIANQEKDKRADELVIANQEKDKRADELVIANQEKDKRADELAIANQELAFQNKEKDKRADELGITNQKLAFQNKEVDKRAEELDIANQELALQNKEKDKRADELGIANQKLAFQNKEKDKRADELNMANKEKDQHADELDIANQELALQNKEKDKRADELVVANREKDKRADELDIANRELAFQNKEKDKRADELVIANQEKDKRSEELDIANRELAFQNKEKDKRADELVIANKEKDKRAEELDIANQELAFQNKEKDKRADELVIANKEKDKRANELDIANKEKENLLQKLKRAASVFTHAHECIMITDANGDITEVNDTFSQMNGYAAKDALGKNPSLLKSGRHLPEFYMEMWDKLQVEGHWRGEIWNRRKNGEIYPAMITISVVKNTAGLVQHYVSLATDISSMKTYQGQLERIAHYDVLTNLPNRVSLSHSLGKAMVQCKRNNRSLAVAFMDLDGFKEINDNHGHNVGDELLVSVSKRMQAALREGDTLARIGGDEFIAVMVNLESPEDSTPVLDRLLEAAATPVTIDNYVMQVSASIGVTLYPQDGSDAEQLMRHADQAMYIAKQAGKNRYRLFDTAQNNEIKRQLASIEDISYALHEGQFVLYYQPKVNMRTNEVIGVEALIRWQHPLRGLIPPLQFLPLIEGHAISLELGEWVINNALIQINQWREMGLNLPISVNISAHQLQQPNFTKRLALLLSAHPEVDPDWLELEILETSALNDISKVSATMQACNELGVGFALDDFGTGYSSLTYFRNLPAQLIKIDQSFIRDMLEDPEDCAIVEGVIGLAKAFRRDVIAEGVETIAHGAMLLQLGCELAQGYGIARPMPASDIAKWVCNWKADDSWLV